MRIHERHPSVMTSANMKNISNYTQDSFMTTVFLPTELSLNE